MKKIWISCVLAVALLPVFAQKSRLEFGREKPLPEYHFELPDSLAHMTTWFPSSTSVPLPDHRGTSLLFEKATVIPMSSVVVVRRENLPKRVTVISNNVLLMPRLTISNGQAWNWGPFPNAYLDARTISVPMGR